MTIGGSSEAVFKSQLIRFSLGYNMADIGNWMGNARVCHILSEWIQLEMTFLTNLKLKKIVLYHKIRNEWPELAHFPV